MANAEFLETRTLTKTDRDYKGSRKFYGPKTSIVSDLPKIGDSWPTDYAYSGWSGVTRCKVESITLDHHFGRTDASATVDYSTRAASGGTTSEGIAGTAADEISVRLEKIDFAAREGTKALDTVFTDQDGLEITDSAKEAEVMVPIVNLRRTLWTETEPELSDLTTMVGKINDDTWEGLTSSNWLCTNVECNQNEGSLFEIRIEWMGLCNTTFNWNQMIKMTKDQVDKEIADGGSKTHYRMYLSMDFGDYCDTLAGGSVSVFKWKYGKYSIDL